MHAMYMDDCYLKEFDATVKAIKENSVVLDKTAFYPTGGGQPNDTGRIIKDGKEFHVTDVTKDSGEILHKLDSVEGMNTDDKVKGIIDWDRRYRLMRMPAAGDVIDAVLYKETGALATGGQLGLDKSRIDFSLEAMDRDQMKRFIGMSNEIVSHNINVKIYYLSREDALKIPGRIKLANVMPPNVDTLRIIEIPGIDVQADGGTQVKNTKEIGEIIMLSVENRGKSNRRIYYTLRD